MYTDPKDINTLRDVERQILDSKEGEDLFPLIGKYIPGWIIDICDDYADDCSMIRSLWHRMCKDICNTKPKKVVIVDKVIFPMRGEEENHLLLVRLLDRLTYFGYCVRDKADLKKCKGCSKAMLVKSNYDRCIKCSKK
jgi:hypothetical protein